MAPPQREAACGLGVPYERAPFRALIVDEDPSARRVAERVLRMMGFAVEARFDGALALELATRGGLDLIITDVSLSGMSGLEFMRSARALGVTAPIVFLTATASVPEVVEAIKSGAFEFLKKPLRARRLREVAVAVLRQRRAQSSMAAAAPEPAGTTNAAEPHARYGDAPAWLQFVSETRPSRAPARRSGAVESVPSAGDSSARVVALHPTSTGTYLPLMIGRHEVVDQIGRGGMGMVYRCRDRLLGRLVAVKVLEVVPERAYEMIARFQREGAATATLHHPNIVALHDMGRDELCGAWFIVMELVQGRGLSAVLREHRMLSEPASVTLGVELADALAYAHQQGVVHRDVKPSNVLIQPDGSAKLVDFGLAAVDGWNVTASGTVLGSPSYMAPERIRGAAGGPAADQFSLGVTLYEATTGVNPFDAATPEARLQRVLQDTPPPAHEARPSVPGALSGILARLMAKPEADRFASMSDAAAVLLQLAHDLGLALDRHPLRHDG